MLTLYEDRQHVLTLSDVQREALCSLKKIIGSQNITVDVDGTVQVMHYVGFYASKELHVQILPKLFSENSRLSTEEQNSRSIELLFRLLCDSGYVKVKLIDKNQEVHSFETDLFEFLIGLFIQELTPLILRQPLKGYHQKQEPLQFVKGKLLLAKTLATRPWCEHEPIVQYNEFTSDILLNRILKTTIQKMYRSAMRKENLDALHRLRMLMEDITPVEINNELFDRINFTRLSVTYENAFSLARLFYQNTNPGMFCGSNQTFSFLVPLNDLYEYSLFKCLEEQASDTGIAITYQKPQKVLCKCDGQGKDVWLQPDILLWRNKKPVCIVDAKYKDIRTLSNADFYQMLAYAVAYDCDNIVLAYPRFSGMEKVQTIYNIHAYGRTIRIRRLDVDILNENWKECLMQRIMQ